MIKQTEEKQKYFHEYWIRNKKYLQEYKRQYRERNKVRILEHYSQYRTDNKDKIQKFNKKYRENNRTKISAYFKDRRKNDINFKLAYYMRTRLRRAIINKQKTGSAVKDLGCTIEELKKYIENKFKNGMNWDNWSQYGWHIDHIVPLINFDLTDRKQFLLATNYSNLQPLWWRDNLTKRKRDDKANEIYWKKLLELK